MPQQSHPFKVAALLGPTAVGKSNLAAEIAPQLGAEIISVDSMQVYRGMDIGTAKPGEDLRQRVPHHLLDMVDFTENYSVAEFQKAARFVIDDIMQRGNLPFLVGGTGLYFEAAVFDMRFPPGSRDDDLRREIEEWAERDPDSLRASLKEADPRFASTQNFTNMRRVIRAMEVYKRTGLPISSFQVTRGCQNPYYRYTGVILNAPRHLLDEAIDRRVDQMIKAGLVEEVRMLKEKGGLSSTAMQALGYKEVMYHLDSGVSLEETMLNIKKRSKQYAKRQLTWLRRIPGLQWFSLKEEDFREVTPPILGSILDYFMAHLKAESGKT